MRRQRSPDPELPRSNVASARMSSMASLRMRSSGALSRQVPGSLSLSIFSLSLSSTTTRKYKMKIQRDSILPSKLQMTANDIVHLIPDVEAPLPLPSGAPQLQSDAIESEKGDPAALPPPYAYPPPPPGTTPLAYSGPLKRRSSCFCCCMCFLFSLLLLFLLLLLLFILLLLLILVVTSVLVGIFFIFFHPQIPKYYINSVRIPHFDGAADASLATTFDVNITASNPNKKIGIYYEGGSHVSVWYADTELCRGSLPTFIQGHRNTTVMEVSLTGNATSLVKAVQVEKRRTGSEHLVIKGTVPVRVKVWKVKLMKI